MSENKNQRRDEVLKRLLQTPPQPRKPTPANEDDPMPTDDPEALIEWGKRNIQKD
jgi:hypothetical protein